MMIVSSQIGVFLFLFYSFYLCFKPLHIDMLLLQSNPTVHVPGKEKIRSIPYSEMYASAHNCTQLENVKKNPT